MRPVLHFDPATVTPVIRRLKGALAIMIYHCHHQVTVFRDCFERASKAPPKPAPRPSVVAIVDRGRRTVFVTDGPQWSVEAEWPDGTIEQRAARRANGIPS